MIFSAPRNYSFNCKVQSTIQCCATSPTQRRRKWTCLIEGRWKRRVKTNDESEEKHNMKRQKMSQVWQHFRLNCKVNTVSWICCNTALVYHNSSISNENTQNGVNNLRHHQLTSFSSFNLFSSSFIRFSSSFLRFSSCFALKHNNNIALAHSNI